MKKIISKTSSSPPDSPPANEYTLIVIEERYLEQKRRGLTEDEVLKPGKYRVRRGRFFDNHPELRAKSK